MEFFRELFVVRFSLFWLSIFGTNSFEASHRTRSTQFSLIHSDSIQVPGMFNAPEQNFSEFNNLIFSKYKRAMQPENYESVWPSPRIIHCYTFPELLLYIFVERRRGRANTPVLSGFRYLLRRRAVSSILSSFLINFNSALIFRTYLPRQSFRGCATTFCICAIIFAQRYVCATWHKFALPRQRY